MDRSTQTTIIRPYSQEKPRYNAKPSIKKDNDFKKTNKEEERRLLSGLCLQLVIISGVIELDTF